MIFRFLIVLVMCGGLFHVGNFTLRHFALLGLFLYLAQLVCLHVAYGKKIRLYPSVLIMFIMIYYIGSLIFINEIISTELFFRYFTLYALGFITFSLFIMFKVLDRVDLRKVVLSTSVVLILLAGINLVFILVIPQPFVGISLFTGTPVENLARLYNRIIMPFGHPAQLGFVAACSAITLSAMCNGKFDKALITLLFIVIFFTASNAIYIPCLLILTFSWLRMFLKRPEYRVILLSVTFTGVLVFLFFIKYGSSFNFRDVANIEESANRHLMLRVQSIDAILNFDIKELFFGVGAGQSRFFIDGSYSFTVLLTLLLEGGVILLLSQIFYFIFLGQASKSLYSWGVFWLTFLSSLFYQMNNDISFYIYPLICIISIESHYEKNLS